MTGRRVTSGCWCLVLLLIGLPSMLMSAPTLPRERTKPEGPNLELKLKNCSLQLDKIRTATRKYFAELGPLNDSTRNIPASRYSTEENGSRSRLITNTLVVTNLPNKISSVPGREKVNTSHLKYLNSLNDSKWVARCLTGEKCIKQTSSEELGQKNQVPERLALNNPIMDRAIVSVSTLSGISAKSESELSEMPNHGGLLNSAPGSRSQSEINSSEINSSDAEIGNSAPALLSFPFEQRNHTMSERNNSLSERSNLSQRMDFIEESKSNSDVHVFPQNITGGNLIYKSPVQKDNSLILPISIEVDELSDDPGKLTSIAVAEGHRKGSVDPLIRSDISLEKEKAPQAIANDDKSLPVSIQLQPVIHNHYYNRRQTKSAQISPEESSSSDSEFPPVKSMVNPNVDVSGSDQNEASSKTEGEIKSSKVTGRCDHPNTPGCDIWGSVENLAAGDLITRFSTGKRQSDGNAINGGYSKSVIKTEIQNTKYPEESETSPSNNSGNSNIFLFMGGQWLVNFKDRPEIFKMKSKTPDALTKFMFQQKTVHPSTYNEHTSSGYGRLGYYDKNCLEYNSRQASYLSSGYLPAGTFQKPMALPETSPYKNKFVGKTSSPYHQNGILPTVGKSSTRDDMYYSSFPYDGYSPATGDFNDPEWEKKYYYANADTYQRLGTNSLHSTEVRMNYPESLVNFPLDKINKYQGDNMGYQESSVKPEESALHDMNPSDMLVVGAQLVSTVQTPEANLPDAVYPLEPLRSENEYSYLSNNVASGRDSIAGYPNQLDPLNNYRKQYQMPSVFNTSQGLGGQQVFIPRQILLQDRNPSISPTIGYPYEQTLSNSWFGNGIGEYEFVNGQYVKRYRGAGVASKQNSYYSEMSGKPSTGNPGGCQEQNQRYPRTISETGVTHHRYRHVDFGPWWSNGLSQNINYAPV